MCYERRCDQMQASQQPMFYLEKKCVMLNFENEYMKIHTFELRKKE